MPRWTHMVLKPPIVSCYQAKSCQSTVAHVPTEPHSPSGIVIHRSEDNAVCVHIPRSYSASTISVPICHGGQRHELRGE